MLLVQLGDEGPTALQVGGAVRRFPIGAARRLEQELSLQLTRHRGHGSCRSGVLGWRIFREPTARQLLVRDKYDVGAGVVSTAKASPDWAASSMSRRKFRKAATTLASGPPF